MAFGVLQGQKPTGTLGLCLEELNACADDARSPNSSTFFLPQLLILPVGEETRDFFGKGKQQVEEACLTPSVSSLSGLPQIPI